MTVGSGRTEEGPAGGREGRLFQPMIEIRYGVGRTAFRQPPPPADLGVLHLSRFVDLDFNLNTGAYFFVAGRRRIVGLYVPK